MTTQKKILSDMKKEIEDKYIVANAMINYGGGFVSNLGEALLRADLHNTERIKKAFPEYWEKYKKFGGEDENSE